MSLELKGSQRVAFYHIPIGPRRHINEENHDEHGNLHAKAAHKAEKTFESTLCTQHNFVSSIDFRYPSPLGLETDPCIYATA